MSELRQLIALREVAKTHAEAYRRKAQAQAYSALFHKDDSTRQQCLTLTHEYHGREMEALFWEERFRSTLAWLENDAPKPESTTVEKSTIVDKQAEATAAAVVLGEEKR